MAPTGYYNDDSDDDLWEEVTECDDDRNMQRKGNESWRSEVQVFRRKDNADEENERLIFQKLDLLFELTLKRKNGSTDEGRKKRAKQTTTI